MSTILKPALTITLYRRPKYTHQLFEALKKCYNLGQFSIHISCDYDPRYHAGCEQVRTMAEDFRTWVREHTQAQCHVYNHNPKLGIDLHKLFIVPQALRSSDMVVFLEDDTIPAPDALNYFCTMVRRYAYTRDVAAICGYNRTTEWAKFHNECTQGQFHATWESEGFNPWGWAMSRDMWRRLFGDKGKQYIADTGTQANGLFDHWIDKKKQRIIRPVVARVQSVGGEDGEHTPSADWHLRNEYNPYGAWLCDNIPDNGLWNWDGKS